MHVRLAIRVAVVILAAIPAASQDTGSATSATATVVMRVRVPESLTLSFGSAHDQNAQNYLAPVPAPQLTVRGNLGHTSVVVRAETSEGSRLLAELGRPTPAVPEMAVGGSLAEPPPLAGSQEVAIALDDHDYESSTAIVEIRVDAY
jgi:hypothetical protein